MDIILKKKIRKITLERNLTRMMSNSKWCELLLAMETEMPFEPPFILKRLDEDISPEESSFENHLASLGDWSVENLCNGNFFLIEWIKIYPFCYIHQNSKKDPKKINATKELKEILDAFEIPYSIKKEAFVILGYTHNS